MAHQSGLNHSVGPGGPPSYAFDPRHQSDAHHQAPFQSPRPEHFPPTSPIFTGTPSLAGPVTPSCTTPPMGTTSILRFPLRSPTLFHGDQHHTAPVSPSRNVMDPNIQLHYSFPHYRSRRTSYSEESPITSTQGGTPHLPGYPGGVMAQPIPNVPAYPTPTLPKHNQSKGSRRNPGLRIDFSPKKLADGVHDNQLPNAGPYPLRSPTYQNLGGSLPANVSEEVRDLRRKVAEYIYQNIEVVKKRYQQSLQELFFLHIGGNIIDFLTWKRISSPQWIAFQATHKLEDDVDFVIPMAPFAPNLVHNVGNMDYIALQHKFYPSNPSAGNMSQGYGAMVSQSISSPFANMPIPQIPHPSGHVSSNPVGAHIDLSSSKLFLSKEPGFGQAFSVSSRRHSSATTTTQGTLSDGRSLVFREVNHSKEDIILEARKEADILKRIAQLRKEGLWSTKRLPKIQEPSRNKSHWDYVLEEMTWLATDFAQEQRWKKGVAKKLSRAVLKYHQDIKAKEVKAEKESTVRLQKIASSVAKEVRQFWINIDKVVHYKVQSRMEEQRKKALDIHLNFIVGQTEKYSSWLAESLKESKPTSSATSSVTSSTAASSPMSSNPDTGDDSELDMLDESNDDEETLDMEEANEHKEFQDPEEEIKALQRESEIPIDDLLESLPLEMFTEPRQSSGEDENSGDDDDDDNETEEDDNAKEVSEFKKGDEEKKLERNENEQSQLTTVVGTTETAPESTRSDKDDEFVIRDTLVDIDNEDTLEEEEKLEADEDHEQEISVLAAEGELPIEELLKKYNVEEDDVDELQVDEESDQSSDEDESSEEDEEGMEFLLQSDTCQDPPVKTDVHSESPNQELTNAAATAESLQPTGYTLETTEVKTPIPFLLRGGTLREYQYIGLDWLVTMYEKCLNGILADEMGLGKTIMTIAVLAHLACERGSWGPHLIVVPTSVMLNWEMEFKKWCPGFKILTYYGSQKERKLKRTGWTKPNAFHVCITSYKLVVQDHQAFRRKKWKYLILDEAQNIKNFKSQRWQYLLNFNTQHRLLLTGTPLQNNLMELWSLMHFLMPHLFESHKDFKEWFSNPLSGMIEGSSEYNENLVKRLHKILRPFLLRRLKSEVEKQMPKKYEHVIRCRLSTRQRVLYDDFMSQSRTKETLESGHLLSVINILMQLRKVCNHPDLFEPRPILTSLKMNGIVYHTASLLLTALERNPLDTINLATMNLILTQLEYNLSAFVGHRVKQLQTPSLLITEVDTYPAVETPFLYPVTKMEVGASTTNHMTNEHFLNNSSKVAPASSSVLYPLRDLALSRPVCGNTWNSEGLLGGVRLVPDTERLCPGYGGKTYTPPCEQDNYNALNSMNSFSNSCSPIDGSTAFGGSQDTVFSTPLHQVPGEVRPLDSNVPYNTQVLPKFPKTLSAHDLRNFANGHASLKSTPVVEQKKLPAVEKPTDVSPAKTKLSSLSPFSLASLEEKRFLARQHKLRFLAAVNERRCMAQPVYGEDLVRSVTVFRNPLERRWCKVSQSRPAICETLQMMAKNPQERVNEMREIINRFVFAIPPVTNPRITMHTSHPPPSHLMAQSHFEEVLQNELSPKMALLHPIIRGKLLQFPEVRLIQYDCGKLQTLDHLLRTLKAEKHRALIFTQMTKMLDVLERFLNYHGYLYVRLDGTTKVEQRQVLMERFNNDKKIFCFILSTRSGGVGVNLTGADTVIFYDSDWNPTMDAQAQDRCHRIGQTRDVHIYRLISEKTIEENILKKAHQKKLLGDIAIEGGNFTTSVLKESTVRDLFSFDHESELQADITEETTEERKAEKKNAKSQNAFEQALMKAEDEQDVKAASLLKAEQAAELDEFDENIPLDEKNAATANGISKVDEELRELENQLSAVERYAVHFVESSYNFVTAEQLNLDQKTVELSKKDWELEHIRAIKEEEERRAAEEEDEIVYVTYPIEESHQGFVDEMTGEEMPLWTPPTPPCDDQEDIYVDHTQNIIYESTPLPEVHLPRETRTRRYLGDYRKHGNRSRFSFRLPYKDAVRRRLRKPQSMFDRRALEAFFKSRRNALSNAKKAKMKLTKQQQQQQQPQQQHPTAIRQQGGDVQAVDTGPEWFIHEDWALLQAVHYLQEVPVDLTVTDLGHTPNWFLVSDIVNASSRAYRTARQCRDRYVNVVMPKEEGKLTLMDDNQKKLKTKVKFPYPTAELQGMTASQHPAKLKDDKGTKVHEMQCSNAGRSGTLLHSTLFDLVKKTSLKRKPSVKQSLGIEPYQKTTCQGASSSGVKVEEVYLDPVRIAALKSERIQREKAEALSRQQLQQQQQQQQQTSQDQQSQQPTPQATHAISQLPQTAVSKIAPSQAQSEQSTQLQAGQPAQPVQNFPNQRLVPHSQILTPTQQKVTTTAQIGSTIAVKTATNLQGSGVVQGTLVKSTTGSSIVVKTPPGNAPARFAAINKRMQPNNSANAAATIKTVKTVVTSTNVSRTMPTQATATQFLASTASSGIVQSSNAAGLVASSAAAVTQAQGGQSIPESVLSVVAGGKTFVHTTTANPITPQQIARLQQQHQMFVQQQQRRQQQQGQQQQKQQQTQGKLATQGALRKVVSSPAAQQKPLPAGSKVGQQRISQTLTLTRPGQQQHQQAVAQQQIKRVQLPAGQQVTTGVVTKTGIMTTGGVNAGKQVLKLHPRTLQNLPPEQKQRILLQKKMHLQWIHQQQQQQHQQHTQKQPQQQQQNLIQSTTTSTVVSTAKPVTQILQGQLQSTASTVPPTQLVTIPASLVGNKTLQIIQAVNKASTVSVQQVTPTPAKPTTTMTTTVLPTTQVHSVTSVTTVTTAPVATQTTQAITTTTTSQHQSPYAMRSRSQSK